MATEIVMMSTYQIRRTRVSALGIKQDIETEEGFTCPGCECPNPELEHGHASQCPNCKMHFRLYGNGLHCSDEFIEAMPVGRDVMALRGLAQTRQKGALQKAWNWLTA